MKVKCSSAINIIAELWKAAELRIPLKFERTHGWSLAISGISEFGVNEQQPSLIENLLDEQRPKEQQQP
jgi:hypothetical protein